MHKDPLLAAVLSFIIPGAGLIYCHAVFRGIILCFLWICVTWNAIADIKTSSFIYYVVLSVVIWLYAVLESRRMATRMNDRFQGRG